MGHKFGYFTLDLPKEEILNRAFSFWASNGGTIISQINSPNTLTTTVDIKRGMSMTSYGEKYTMKFGFNPYNKSTYVSVEVTLSFGSGMQWLKPQGIMKRWALELGTVPMKLERTIDPNFINMFDDIQNISLQPEMQEPIMFCPSCGKTITEITLFVKSVEINCQYKEI